MDPSLIAEQPTGLYGWILQYGQVVAFVAQLFYWLAMVILLAYAVVQYKRWVNYQMGVGKSGQLRKDQDGDSGKGKGVSVEEFVE